VFLNRVLVRTDGVLTALPADRGTVRRSSKEDTFLEWYIVEAGAHLETIARIVASKKCLIRFEGEENSREFEVTTSEKRQLDEMLLLYRYLATRPEELERRIKGLTR